MCKKNWCRCYIFYFKCYFHHNCSINLNWNNTQFYSSAKPLCNVPSSVFWFVNFCFLPFLHRTSIQKWKKNWFCYVCKWIDKKNIAKISKYVAAAKILDRKEEHLIIQLLWASGWLLLALSTQKINYPSRKWGYGVSPRFHFTVFVIGVNQEKWKARRVQDYQHQWWKASPQTFFQL